MVASPLGVFIASGAPTIDEAKSESLRRREMFVWRQSCTIAYSACRMSELKLFKRLAASVFSFALIVD